MQPLPYASPQVPPHAQLSPEHLQQIAAARVAQRKIKRAISTAQWDGWIIAILAALSLVSGLTDAANIVMSLLLGTIAYIELRGADQLKRLNLKAPRTLAFNQLALASILLIYALWHIITEFTGAGLLKETVQSDPMIGDMLDSYAPLLHKLVVLFYCAVIGIAIFCQGGMAWYYHSRRKYLQKYLQETPPWIIAMQNAGMSI